MNLLMTKSFNGVQLDCYRADNADDSFWATREQIGRLLGYAEPMKSIAKIHERNSTRLDNFSTIVKLTTVEGIRTVTREVIVYNFKGLLEICRYSNQPKANEVMDFLWDIADEIRRTGFYVTPKAAEAIHRKRMADFDRAMKHGKEVYMSMGYRGVKLAVALDKIYKDYLGFSALEIAGIDPQEAVYETTPNWIRRILDYMKEYERIAVTPMDLVHELGLSCSAARVQLRRMVQQGYLRKVSYGVYALDENYKD